MTEVRLRVFGRWRTHGKLDRVDVDHAPALADVLAARRSMPEAEALWLCGGEPTLRADLPALLSALAEAAADSDDAAHSDAAARSVEAAPPIGMLTDGLALASPDAVRTLSQAGLRRVRIGLHSGRADAHDWLVGMEGAAKRAVRAVRTCLDGGLGVGAEVVVTRPTTPHLEETVVFLARIGVDEVLIRAPRAVGAAAVDYVAIAPRLGILEPYLRAALAAGRRLGLRQAVQDLPRCVAGDRAPIVQPVFLLDEPRPTTARCAQCDPASCPGVPAEYVHRFGWAEIHSVSNAPEGRALPRAADALAPPPPRAKRFPETRVRFSVQQAARGPLGGDPLLGVARREVPDSIRVCFDAPSRISCPECGDHGRSAEPTNTRTIRKRMVDAAQQGAPCLRIASAGSLAHPDALDLLADARRLSFEEIEVCGEGSALNEWGEREIRRTRGISRVFVALYGPDAARHDAHVGRPGAFAATLAGLKRFTDLVGAEAGSYAVLHGPDDVVDYAAAWSRGELPGPPGFRLSPRGGALAALAGVAANLPDGVRDALAEILPVCLLPRAEAVQPARPAAVAWGDAPQDVAPSGSDRLGTYAPCPLAADCAEAHRCPGLAHGWDPSGIAAVRRG